MFFQFTSEVTGLAGHLGKSDALEFCFDSPRVVSVHLSKSYPDGLKPKVRADAVCTSTTTAEPSDAKITAELKAGWVVPVVEGVQVGFREVGDSSEAVNSPGRLISGAQSGAWPF